MVKKLSASFQPEKQVQVKSGSIKIDKKLKAELAALKYKKVDLSDPDAPEITNWQKGIRGKFYRPIKKQITIRIDGDVLEWFKEKQDKYQTLINEVCRTYMLKHLEN